MRRSHNHLTSGPNLERHSPTSGSEEETACATKFGARPLQKSYSGAGEIAKSRKIREDYNERKNSMITLLFW